MVRSQEMSLVLKVSAQSPHIENYTLLKLNSCRYSVCAFMLMSYNAHVIQT